MTSKITPFWYRRICEITLLISLIVVGLFGAGLLAESGMTSLFVPFPAAALAAVTAAVSFVAYLWAPERYLFWVAAFCYLLLSATTGLLITSTGQVASPFLALWMLIAVFSGLFTWYGIGTLFIAINAYLSYLIFVLAIPLSQEQYILYALAGELPILISYVIWHSKSSNENQQQKAFSALAQQLSQVANKSEIVINAIADGVIAIDGKGQIQLINPAAQTLIGWTKEDAMGLDYHSVVKLSNSKGEDIPPELDPLQQVMQQNKTVVNNKLTLTTMSGKKLMISLVVSPVNPTEANSGAIAVFRDITAEKAEERQQAEFISTASHEMRTPVAAIEGYLGLALNPATANIDDKARAYLQKAHESAQHLGRLFQDLLDVTKAEDGRLNSNPTVVDVVALVGDVGNILTPKAKEKGLFLYCKPCDQGNSADPSSARRISPVFYSHLDQDHLREVLSNLVENAIKYTKTGTITVDVEGDEKEITISVADTGIGIPLEDLPHLFQKFYRVDNSETREIGGTGLGLYLCRRLIESAGGRVWVKSEFGKGSTFFAAIPRISHEKATELIEQEEKMKEKDAHPAIIPTQTNNIEKT